jgi:KaiC/GvpD/RAD55 family RecA-like ATPase
LILIGGETGTGKTTFATNIIYKASKKTKCCIFALERPLQDFAFLAIYFEIGRLRKLKGLSNYPWNEYRKNNIKDANYISFENQAFENLKNGNIKFAKVERQLDIETLENKIDEKVKEGFGLFMIDHLHYFDLSRGNETKSDYIEKVMVRLKTLQNRTGAKILLIVHYKKLEGKKPTIDSFKDSIAIPQNADYVINLWRDRSVDADKNKTLLMCPKSRNPNGEFSYELEFDPATNDYKPIQSHFGSNSSEDFRNF